MIQADIQANGVYSGTNRPSQANIRDVVGTQDSSRAHRGTRKLLLRASIGQQPLAALLGAIIMCLIFDIYHRPARDGSLLVLLCSEEVDLAVLTVGVRELLKIVAVDRIIGIRPATGPLPSATSSPDAVRGSPRRHSPPNHGTASLLCLCLGATMTCRYSPHSHLSNASVFSHAAASNASNANCHLK